MTKTQAWPPQVCAALERMDQCREAEKTREADLVRHRKEVRDEFLALGPGDSEQHKTLALDLVKTLLHIDYCRNHQRTLADKIGETIRNAHQPGLYGDEHDLEDITSREPDEDELFAALRKPSKSDPDQQEFGEDDRPVGEYDSAGAAALSDVKIDDYLPGRYADEAGQERNIDDMDDLRRIAEVMGTDVEIEPRPAGVGIEIHFLEKGQKLVHKLSYVSKPKGKRKAG